MRFEPKHFTTTLRAEYSARTGDVAVPGKWRKVSFLQDGRVRVGDGIMERLIFLLKLQDFYKKTRRKIEQII